MSANGGIPAPSTQPRENLTECCARCRAGTKALGRRPCGYGWVHCPNRCHE